MRHAAGHTYLFVRAREGNGTKAAGSPSASSPSSTRQLTTERRRGLRYSTLWNMGPDTVWSAKEIFRHSDESYL